jgi:hypothetical protein
MKPDISQDSKWTWLQMPQGHLKIWRFTHKINSTQEIFAQPRTSWFPMQIRGLKRPLMAKCWLPKLWSMLIASIWTYGKPNSVQGARRYALQNTYCVESSKSERLSCEAILGISSSFARKPMNTKVEDYFVTHNLDTEFALFGVRTWDLWRRQGRAAKQENMGEADFMEPSLLLSQGRSRAR